MAFRLAAQQSLRMDMTDAAIVTNEEIRNTKYEIRNTQYEIRNTKYAIRNTQ